MKKKLGVLLRPFLIVRYRAIEKCELTKNLREHCAVSCSYRQRRKPLFLEENFKICIFLCRFILCRFKDDFCRLYINMELYQRNCLFRRKSCIVRLLLSLIFRSVLITNADRALACPEECSCSGRTVDCEGRGLTYVPKNFPENTERM